MFYQMSAVTNLQCTILATLLFSLPRITSPYCTRSSHTKSICVPSDYVKFELPPESPTTVSIGIDIKDIPNVNDFDFSVTLNGFFLVRWQDPRLIMDNVKFGGDALIPVDVSLVG